MKSSPHCRSAAGAALAACLLLGVAGAAATELRHPELAPPGECALPLPPVSEGGSGLAAGSESSLAAGSGSGLAAGTGGGTAVVASLTGRARVRSAQGQLRDLARGDAIQPGDQVSTTPGSSAGLLLGTSLLQLGASSSVEIRGPAGSPQVVMQSGQLRVVDSDAGATPLHVEAAGAAADVSGNDVQITLGEAGSSAATVCSLGSSLRLSRGSATTVVARGSCAVIGAGAEFESRPFGSQRLPLLAGVYEFRPSIDPFAHLEPGPSVAAGGSRGTPPLPEPEGGPSRSPCDVPGSGCGGGFRTVEPPPTTDPFPGGQRN